ncbi:hypothetical protein Aca07nite_77040 [Actinoplanes capillaceus]|uniref:Uncharacterized protein n=1 Tax=Actinoplanes campanulatus TaxID=113559 RepID=A0ABQ3WW62_9ACTN|nr:hypothetical protein Aca07nite_77040 [Actinoplanes capillaceus]
MPHDQAVKAGQPHTKDAACATAHAIRHADDHNAATVSTHPAGEYSTTTVLIADDQPLQRHGFRTV